MARLEDLTRGAAIRGILPECSLAIEDVKWCGAAAVELTYKDSAGKPGVELLDRDCEPVLEVVEIGRSWSFNGDGQTLRLVSESHRSVSPTKTETNEQGEDTEREIPFMKGYTVFNVEQVEGLPAHYYAQPENPLPLSERIENADRFMTNTAATIHHGGNSAFYAPARDAIQLPPFEAFKDKESYYATALHELATGRSTSAALNAISAHPLFPFPPREKRASGILALI